jgi:tRNA (guanine37-N1)-methyltransferase
MRFDIITIFPKIFDSYFSESILKRAREKKLVDIRVHNLRDFSRDTKHKKVDDKLYGGGAGMVIQAEPVLRAVSALKIKNQSTIKSGTKIKIIILSAKGKQFNQKMAADWARKYERLILISGRYEGIDERVKTVLRAEEISVGPYVLTDGDAAAMVVLSAVTRLIPGVIKLESLEEESHWNLLLKKEASVSGKGLEYPHYTRPEALSYKGKKYRVPKVLLSGNHKKIEEWRNKHRR